MRVLVTGGAGFVGLNVVEALLARGERGLDDGLGRLVEHDHRSRDREPGQELRAQANRRVSPLP